MNIEFKTDKQIQMSDLITLYSSVGWNAYTTDPYTLNQAIINSTDVITSWQNNKLIGLIRAVGDKQTILYIQDILVDPNFQNQGIGTKLVHQILDKYKNVRQKLLLTENTPQTTSFYKKQGFVDTQKLNLISFYREH